MLQTSGGSNAAHKLVDDRGRRVVACSQLAIGCEVVASGVCRILKRGANFFEGGNFLRGHRGADFCKGGVDFEDRTIGRAATANGHTP